jgi:hypothetical protein
MAQEQNTSNNQVRTFDKSLNEDVNDFHLPSNEWTHGRNVINNSVTGDLGKLGNEPANILCVQAPYPIIGFIHIIEDRWAVFSTDGTNSEIGLFIEGNCGTLEPAYYTIVNAPCLKFNIEKLIIGVSRPTSTCTYKLYWDDGINPSRVLEIDIDNPSRNWYTDPNSTLPWVQNCVDSNGPSPGGCIICTNTPVLDCDKIRLALFINPICPRVENGTQGGNLLNGSYMVAMAYAIKGQKISDWYVSNVQSLWTHQNSSGSIDVFIDSIDPDFDEVIVTVISVTNQQTVARQAGVYSTRQTRLGFDIISDTWPAVPIEQLPLMTPIIDKSDAMYNVGDYLIRVGPTSKEDFNYQPLANQIVSKWQSVEYPADYYYKGNNKTGYMRDEVYPFFIVWEYDTGDESAAYHIPGRPAFSSDLTPPAGNVIAGETQTWQVYNTATQTATPGTVLPDGGVVIAEGLMGYWQSTEYYPDKKPQVWNASAHCWSSLNPGSIPGCLEPTPPIPYTGTASGLASFDLCGTPIRHHKFPEDSLTTQTNRFNAGVGNKIRIMGVKFENIRAPRRSDGSLIPGIIGYKIMRGTRNGNKTVIAKGMINNTHEYDIPGAPGTKGYYPNYPFNDLRDDPFLSTTQTSTASILNPALPGGDIKNYNAMPGGFGTGRFSPNLVTFHSPETNFNNPYLATKELRIYQGINGNVKGKFEISEQHPKEKLITDMAFIIASIGGLGVAALATNGNRRVHREYPNYQGFSQEPNYFTKNTYNLNENGSINGTDTSTQAPYPEAGTETGGPLPTPVATANLITPTPIITTLNETTTNNVNGTTDLSVPQKTNIISQPAPTHLPIMSPALVAVFSAFTGYDAVKNSGASLALTIVPGTTDDVAQEAGMNTANTAATSSLTGVSSAQITIENEDGDYQGIPQPFRTISSFPLFLNYYSDGTDSLIRLIRAIIRYKDYVVRYHSHGFYNRTENRPVTFRTALSDQQYIDPEIVDYSSSIRINNLYRQRTVALATITPFGSGIGLPTVADKTRYDYAGLAPSFWPTGILGSNWTHTAEALCSKWIDGSSTVDGANNGQVASSWYGALKVRIDNQYGQLNNIVQVPISHCFTPVTINRVTKQITSGSSTGPLFGGDIYVNRYTEKNTFLFFYDWLYGQLDGAQLDYLQHQMIPYPKYWCNFNQFQTNDFTSTIFQNLITWNWPSGTVFTPSSYYAVDGPGNVPLAGWNILANIANAFFLDKKGWMYLSNCGVRDFFVESEINLAQRDYGDIPEQKFYNPYNGGSTKDLFSTGIIKSGNYYKYDQSLSISKLFINYASWSSTQSPSYDPYIAETCFVYRPTRVIYSLPAQFEGLRDGWMVFLPNNYYDFINLVTCIKPVNKNGAMIFFNAASPVQFQGLDQLQTDLGTKLTIGDGGLFSQPLQQIINVDASHEYASCQNRMSVINTPAGLYWISQNQGKIFNYAGGLKEISNIDLKWWFAQYLPYTLTKDFPSFELVDNPVMGIGCQSVYDNENSLVYFSKRDFRLKLEYTPDQFEYLGGYQFRYLVTGLLIDLGDPDFFDDTSWTASFDPKTNAWLGWHDWHQTLNMPGKNTFMTVNPIDKRGIWIHNERCDLYCNYYGVDYPFEVEFKVNTGGTVNTLRSIEYIMEVYKYALNCYDRFHVLDFNFDEAIVYNTEQVSGLLRLNLKPKQDPSQILQYPIVNLTNIDIIFSKEENKYRFNQFWDITADRGEYNPAAQRVIWDTAPNGYAAVLNPFNLDYAKPPMQRKKFRHYTVTIRLRRNVSGDRKMLVMLADIKNLYSPR